MRATHRRIPVGLLLLACSFLASAGNSAHAEDDPLGQVQRRMVKLFGAGGVKGIAGYGTGFLVTKEGHIVTVWSPILDADNVTVVLFDGRRLEAEVLGAEPQLDVAVLKIKNLTSEVEFFDLEKIGTASVGSRILGFSNMFRVAGGDEEMSVLHGVISAKTELRARRGVNELPYRGPVYIVDAITNNPGAAGGVLTDRAGTLIGMIGKEVRSSRSNTWINYAVPLTELKKTIEQIVSGNYIEQPKKPDEEDPDRYQPLDFGIVLIPDVIFRTPAYIESILGDTPAAEKGLRPDDLVLFVNDELVQSAKELKKALGALESGDTLQLVVRRKNLLVTVEMPVPKKGE